MAESFNFTFKSNVKNVKEAEKKAVEKALTMIGTRVEERAVKKCPVDTGLLRNSITYALGGSSTAKSSYKADKSKDGKELKKGSYNGTIGSKKDNAVYVGTNVEYASVIEHGSSEQAPEGFLRNAVNDSENDIKTIIKREFGG